MSTITVTNIKATGETINRPVAGVAAAYADFNTSSNDTIEDSVNIASKTDNGTGDSTLNYTNSMASSNYSSQANGSVNAIGNSNMYAADIRGNAKLAASCRMQVFYDPSTVTGNDSDHQSLLINGDLA
mgnify:CR=1 FL=1|tara:strand:- start:71 stop:454 length:384 start_codon:yes stop_codon:yes gene_type:complete